jgi:transketolase
MSPASNLDTARMANAIRFLSADAVEKAKSGHPGMPMGMAEIAVALWSRHLRHNPANPHWAGRDRFVLSNGHGSMLLYSLLHLTGYDLPIGEIENFRQLHSKTPGHPEVGVTPGVETTTGPLGQGLANAVGMALAEKLLGAEFNKDDARLVDHNTYVFLGDGCLMEGISHEACALAGTWQLGKLIALYDDNGISIDGDVKGWFTDDTAERFRAYHWQVIGPVDGHDVDAVDRAIEEAKANLTQPSLIICRTTIGQGAPTRAGTAKAHGEALGADELAATRKALGWNYAPFEIPDDITAMWNARTPARSGRRMERTLRRVPQGLSRASRRIRAPPVRRPARGLRAGREQARRRCERESRNRRLAQSQPVRDRSVRTRAAGNARRLGRPHAFQPDLVEGRAAAHGGGTGRHISYGVREFGMAAIMNGITLHGGFLPFGGTFLTFSDYSRNAIRMAALMNLRVVHVFTHDSIGLGEDGPTHQSIEQVSSLRLIPNLDVWRPCDTVETAVAWKLALERDKAPTALALSRQNLPFVPRSDAQIAAIERGGYVLADAQGAPARILVATGSEVGLALAAKKILDAEGLATRVVSMPSTEAFDRQDAAYRASVLPAGVRKVAIEAGTTALWWKYVGEGGAVVGIDRFGESAPAPKLFELFGFTPEHVAKVARGG